MSLHDKKCIFCHAKKPNVMVKYKWEALHGYFKAIKDGHSSPYLENEFRCKQFW